MPATHLVDRGVIRVSGEDARDFLQNIVTNDMDAVTVGRAGYGALLTPQGKIIGDFVLVAVPKQISRKLQQDAVRQKLNLTQLRKLKLRIEGSKGSGGRKPDVMRWHTRDDLHAAIHIEAGRWHRWLDQLLGASPEIEPLLKKRLNELRDVVRDVKTLSGG